MALSKALVVFKRCNIFDANAFQWEGVERECGEERDDGEDLCNGCNDSTVGNAVNACIDCNDGNAFNAGIDGNDGNGFRV